MKTLTATVVTVTMAMTAGQTMAAAAAPAATPTAPAALNIAHGPPITGICVQSNSLIQNQSLYGKAIDKQLEAIGLQTNKELSDLKSKIMAEGQAVDKTKGTVSELQYSTQMLTVQDKANSFQTLVNQRQQELDLTEQQQNQAFSIELQKIAVAVYQEQKCSLLLDRDASVMLLNPAMDVTDLIVKAMDKDKSTVAPFARATLPPQPVPTGATATK